MSAPTPPADLCRRAATVLRERAQAAHRASPSPWTATDEHVVRCADGMIVADRSGTDHPAERADLPYIATMHPGVGAALADWLDRMAEASENVNDWTLGVVSTLLLDALAVARAVLGEGEQR